MAVSKSMNRATGHDRTEKRNRVPKLYNRSHLTCLPCGRPLRALEDDKGGWSRIKGCIALHYNRSYRFDVKNDEFHSRARAVCIFAKTGLAIVGAAA
jgi:hypothetical protein